MTRFPGLCVPMVMNVNFPQDSVMNDRVEQEEMTQLCPWEMGAVRKGPSAILPSCSRSEPECWVSPLVAEHRAALSTLSLSSHCIIWPAEEVK